MSGDTPYICINSSLDNGTINDTNDANKLDDYDVNSTQFCDNVEDETLITKQHRDNDNNLFLGFKQSGSVTITMADLHNQPMPEGTIVSFTSSVGSVTSQVHQAGQVMQTEDISFQRRLKQVLTLSLGP